MKKILFLAMSIHKTTTEIKTQLTLHDFYHNCVFLSINRHIMQL